MQEQLQSQEPPNEDSQEDWLKCFVCSKPFPDVGKLRTHETGHKNFQDTIYLAFGMSRRCPICNCTFQRHCNPEARCQRNKKYTALTKHFLSKQGRECMVRYIEWRHLSVAKALAGEERIVPPYNTVRRSQITKRTQWRDYDLAVTRQKLYQSKGKVALVEPLDPRPSKPKWTGRPCRRKEITSTPEWKEKRAKQTKKYREKCRERLNEYARNRYRNEKRKSGRTVIPNKRTDKDRKKVKRWWSVKPKKGKREKPTRPKAGKKQTIRRKKVAIRRRKKPPTRRKSDAKS